MRSRSVTSILCPVFSPYLSDICRYLAVGVSAGVSALVVVQGPVQSGCRPAAWRSGIPNGIFNLKIIPHVELH